ncbi:MAG: hypothetical protein ACRDK3_08930 [Actinomycetota bacterium]
MRLRMAPRWSKSVSGGARLVVVEAAYQGEVAEVGGTAPVPGPDVVGVDVALVVAAWEGAAAVTPPELRLEPPGDGPRCPSDAGGVTLGVVHHGADERVAAQRRGDPGVDDAALELGGAARGKLGEVDVEVDRGLALSGSEATCCEASATRASALRASMVAARGCPGSAGSLAARRSSPWATSAALVSCLVVRELRSIAGMSSALVCPSSRTSSL